MCRGCRVERLKRYDGSLDKIRTRVENYKKQQPTGANLIAKDRETLLGLLDEQADECVARGHLTAADLQELKNEGRREAVRDANDWLNAHSSIRMTPEDHAEWWAFLRENGYDPLTGLYDRVVAGLKESDDSSNASESDEPCDHCEAPSLHSSPENPPQKFLADSPNDESQNGSEGCSCGRIAVGMTVTENRNWNPDCTEHGIGTEWYESPETKARFAEREEQSRDLQRRAREARRNALDNS